jgi:hypothetical protein
MAPFLFAFLLVSALMVSSVVLSVYLYARGAMSSSPINRSQRERKYTVEPTMDDTAYINLDAMDDETTRYARGALLIGLAIVMVVVMFVFSVISAVH